MTKFHLFIWILITSAAVSWGSALPLDTEKYIPLGEVKAGMEAYCLTVYQGTRVERFEMEVIDVMHKFQPGQDRIVVRGKDPRFIATGPVQGCSGSPVYINGRMAGALSSGWGFSKEPLYMVTPIEEMLEIPAAHNEIPRQAVAGADRLGPRINFDYSRPLNLARMQKTYESALERMQGTRTGRLLPVVSSLPESALEEMADDFRRLGLEPIAASASAGSDDTPEFDISQVQPGAVLGVPIVSGDISLAAVGTITDVLHDPANPDQPTLLAFGHDFTGMGPTELPISLGTVHTVVANQMFSFKLGSSGEPMGTLLLDQTAGVYGQVGRPAPTIDLNMTITHPGDVSPRDYHCKLAVHRAYSPLGLRAALVGAANRSAGLPIEHTLRFRAAIEVEGYPPLRFSNVSTDMGFAQVLEQTALLTAVLLSNPFEEVTIRSIDVELEIEPVTIISELAAVNISNMEPRAGETIHIDLLMDTFRGGKVYQGIDFNIPRDLLPGKYPLRICGAFSYESILSQNVPHRLSPVDVDSLMQALELVTSIPGDRIYVTLGLNTPGLTIRTKELPRLPGTKALLLMDPKRADMIMPMNPWAEKRVKSDVILMDDYTVNLTIRKD